jgi:hypothetical protein
VAFALRILWLGSVEGDGMQHVSPLDNSMAEDVAVGFCLERILLEWPRFSSEAQFFL